MSKKDLSDELLLELAHRCKNSRQLWQSLGYRSHCSYTKYLKPRLKQLGFEFSGSKGAFLSDDQILEESRKHQTRWALCVALGICPALPIKGDLPI